MIYHLKTIILREYKIDKQYIKTKSSKNHEQMKEILTYLHEHYQEPLSLNDMAASFYMSKEHFSRQFHLYVGKTFRDYLASYRLYKAYEDIINTDMTVQDIARSSNYFMKPIIKHHFNIVRKCQEIDIFLSIKYNFMKAFLFIIINRRINYG